MTDDIYDGLECGNCGTALVGGGDWCGNTDCYMGPDEDDSGNSVNGEVVETDPNAAPPGDDPREELSEEKRKELAELDPTLAPEEPDTVDDEVIEDEMEDDFGDQLQTELTELQESKGDDRQTELKTDNS